MTSSNRLWILVTAILAIAIVALGWFLGISPKLDEAKVTDLNRSTVDSLNQQKTIELQQLQKDSTNLPAIRSQLAELLTELPPNSNYPAFLTELNQIAGAHNVSVTALAFAAPTPAVAPTLAPVTGAAPAPGATPAPPAVVTNAVAPGTTVVIPTTMTLKGSFGSLQAAVGELQTGARLFVMSGLAFKKVDPTTAPSTNSANATTSDYTVDITGTIYVITDGSTLISSSASPAPTATPTATATP